MNAAIVYLNGDLVSGIEAAVGVGDRGLLYGDGLYETIRVRNCHCLRLNRHVQRLLNGLEALRIENPFRHVEVEYVIKELLEANNLTDARVRVTITRGPCQDSSRPTAIVAASPLADEEPRATKVILSSFRRDEANPLTAVKSLNCLASVAAAMEAQEAGADDAILLNTRGSVAEATFANVFAVSGRRLVTPSLDQGCLPGTLRAAVLEMAAGLGLEPREEAVDPEMLFAADEVFLTSAIKLARPVVEINGRAVGCGEHQVCKQVREALLEAEQKLQPS